MTAPPFDKATVEEYQRLGYVPILLPHMEKAPPPKGFTGYDGGCPSPKAIARWLRRAERSGGNIGLVLPETVVGIDVDCYDGKPGAETIAAKEALLGPLPDSPAITSRDDGSGIRLYRVPPGRRWVDAVGPGVEVIHHGHRYVVAPPSVHPEGRVYRGAVRADDDLPALPDAWVAHLSRGDLADRPVKVDADVAAWLDALPCGEPTDYARRVLAEAADAYLLGGSRHGIAAKATGQLVRAGERGEPGVAAALDECKAAWLDAMGDDRPREVEGEWARLVSGAVGLVLASPTPTVQEDFDVITAEPVQERAAGGGWEPVDLTAIVAGLLDGTIARPEPTVGEFGGGCLFYAGRINSVHGDSTAGKTWTALVTAAQEMDRGEAVVYVDLEDAPEGVASRLIVDLGVPADAVRERFVYLHPDEPLSKAAADGLAALLAARRPSLVVVDSTGEALAIEGANPNADEEVARWFRLLPGSPSGAERPSCSSTTRQRRATTTCGRSGRSASARP